MVDAGSWRAHPHHHQPKALLLDPNRVRTDLGESGRKRKMKIPAATDKDDRNNRHGETAEPLDAGDAMLPLERDFQKTMAGHHRELDEAARARRMARGVDREVEKSESAMRKPAYCQSLSSAHAAAAVPILVQVASWMRQSRRFPVQNRLKPRAVEPTRQRNAS